MRLACVLLVSLAACGCTVLYDFDRFEGDAGDDEDAGREDAGDVPPRDASACDAVAPEVCDDLDNDCDTLVDEGIDLMTDATNCGACGMACEDTQSCVDGACVMPVVSIGAGSTHTCAALQSGRVYCWGADDGRLGRDANTMFAPQTQPAPVVNLDDAVEVAGGGGSSCARRRGGQVVCWGQNFDGQLGSGGTGRSTVPVLVQGLTDATAIAMGQRHACAVRTTGGLVCWGDDNEGQLGDGGGFMRSLVPVPVSGLTDVTAVGAGRAFTCAVSGGKVYCWGVDDVGQLGRDSSSPANSDVPIELSAVPADTVAVTGGNGHACASTLGGQLWCWGHNFQGQLGGAGGSGSFVPPGIVPSFDAPSLVDGGFAQHTCAVRGGSAFCWGDNAAGQLGDGSPDDRAAPVLALEDVVTLGAGERHTCAARRDGRVFCWGSNAEGQLGRDPVGGISRDPIEVVFDP